MNARPDSVAARPVKATDARAHRRAILMMLCAATLWSTAGVVTRHLESAGRFEVTFWRSLSAATFVLVTLLLARVSPWRAVRATGGYGLMSGAMWAVMFTCFMLALTTTTVANTLIVNSVAPLITALLALVVLRTPIEPHTWFAIALAIGGMLWMFGAGFAGGEPRHAAGMLIALAVPFANAANLVTLKRAGRGIDLIPAILLGAVISAMITLPLALPFSASPHDIALLALLGCFQLGFPCMLMIRASPHLSAPEISLLALLEVVLGPLWAWLGAGEVPAFTTLAGGAVVITALVLNQLAASGVRR